MNIKVMRKGGLIPPHCGSLYVCGVCVFVIFFDCVLPFGFFEIANACPVYPAVYGEVLP